jgi:GNAT superfamily N-acetyltransferase
MLVGDVNAAVMAVRQGGWGERRASFEFYAQHRDCHPFVAEADGTVVGTAIATHNGDVGWVGLVFVAPEWRGRGLGGELTQATLRCFEELGCRSVVLAATELGRPVYERLGFVPDGEYAVFHGPPQSERVHHPHLRDLTPADLPAVCALDRQATAEDRSHLIEAAPEGWVIDDGQAIRGFAVRAPWAAVGAAIAPDATAGALLLDVLRTRSSATDMVMTTVASNSAAMPHLQRVGFQEERRLPRMVLGHPVPWQPTHIWTIFNFAVG